MKIIILNKEQTSATKPKQQVRIILPPVRDKVMRLRPRKRRNYLGPIGVVDFKYISNILHSHCLSHCNMTYGKGTCLKMECFKTLQKVDRELGKEAQ